MTSNILFLNRSILVPNRRQVILDFIASVMNALLGADKSEGETSESISTIEDPTSKTKDSHESS